MHAGVTYAWTTKLAFPMESHQKTGSANLETSEVEGLGQICCCSQVYSVEQSSQGHPNSHLISSLVYMCISIAYGLL